MSLHEYKLKNLGDKIREQAVKAETVEVKEVKEVKEEVKKRRLNK